MYSTLKYFIIISICFLSVFKAKATHIVGGEIYYDKLGGTNYKITLKVYRDCLNGIPPFDSPAIITIFDINGNYVNNLSLSPTYTLTVPPTNNSPCAPSTNGNACVEEAKYEGVISLPPLTGGYTIVYQRCCRNNTILNLVNPQNIGATYWEHIPGPEAFQINSSPRFTKRPPIYICANNPIAFDHSATDPDGDSLVYSLCTPYHGLDPCCPIIPSAQGVCATGCPSSNQYNAPPPYTPVPFASPYSASYPLSSSPAININPQTGFLNGAPNMLGQWVVGVCVSEYRNGQLIETHHRDFQFNVINCPFVVTANITQQTSITPGSTGFCNGFVITYTNTSSSNATSFFWDFGDPNTTTDTSYSAQPSYSFTSPGDYTVTLIANPGSACADTSYEPFHVYTLLAPTFAQPASQCFNGNTFTFTAGGSYQGNGTISWDFGNNVSPSTANTATVTNVHYTSPGVNTVSLTISENGCTATTVHTIEVAQNPIAAIGNYNNVACSPATFTIENISNTGPYIKYLWTFSNGITTNSFTPIVTFTTPGVYTFTLSALSNQVCIDTTKITSVTSITLTPTPTASFNILPDINQCFDGHFFDFKSTSTTFGNPIYNWNFGVTATPMQATSANASNVTFSNNGIHTITLTVTENGCPNSINSSVALYNNPIANIGSFVQSGCNPLTIFFPNNSTSDVPLNYSWEFSDGTTSTDKNPTHVFTPQGVYSVSLTVSSNSLCVASSSTLAINSITVFPIPVSVFTATPIETSIFDPEITFKDLSSSDVVAWTYDFADGTNSTSQNPFHAYITYGTFNVQQTVTNNFGCPHTSSLEIKIIPEFRFWIPNCFTPYNKDYLNDEFKPKVIGVENYTFMIFDRWGSMIFQTNDINEGWNGNYKGKRCQVDVYVWKCEFKNVVSNLRESHIGHVTLLD